METIEQSGIKGEDLSVSLLLAPEEAVSGSYVKVVTPLDGEILVKVPEGTKAETRLRMQGLGSRKGNSDERGDLYVTVMIMTTDERRNESSSSIGEGAGFQIVGGCIIALGVILLLGNITGIMPTFPFAGFLAMIVGGLISRLGKTSGM
ncbi:MAG TPA: DnaJ C-terminal domain-containing protein [Pyrinomonadaceae bacterium]|jgi:hypothetical protein